jgi:glycosyltransferase involved in cell wall biosynthesis
MPEHILEFLTYAGIGGTQRMFIEFLRHASHDKYNFYVCVLLAHGFVNEKLTEMNVVNTCLNMRGYWDLTAWWKLYAFAKGKQIDLIRTYGLKAHLIGRIVGKILGIPVNITSVRSTDPWRKWYHVLLDFLTSGLTDLYIANSEAGRKITHQRERIPLSKIVTIPNGIDMTKYLFQASDGHKLAAAYKQRFGIAREDRVIGIVANFRKMKGHQTIVDALSRIQAEILNIKCLFVGDEFVNEKSYKQELYKYVQETQLEHTIIFTGTQEDIPGILSVFDLFLLPSLWEGFPTSILEAMAMKKPVIASAVGGIPEIIVPDKTGILIPPQNPDALADAILFLLNNPDIASKMGEAGYERVRRCFTLESVVAQTETIYDQLMKNDKDFS